MWKYCFTFFGILNTKIIPHENFQNVLQTLKFRELRNIKCFLGDTGRSFVVGFGNNPPVQPHHRGSSCTPNTDCSNMGED